jgi:hypothetical protein
MTTEFGGTTRRLTPERRIELELGNKGDLMLLGAAKRESTLKQNTGRSVTK